MLTDVSRFAPLGCRHTTHGCGPHPPLRSHIDWHMAAGLLMTLVVEPQLLAGIAVPPDALALCQATAHTHG